MTLKIKRPKDLPSAFSKAKADAVKHKITFTGDENRGSGSGFGFAGSYRVYGDFIEITVTKKPPLISKGLITKKIEEYCKNL